MGGCGFCKRTELSRTVRPGLSLAIKLRARIGCGTSVPLQKKIERKKETFQTAGVNYLRPDWPHRSLKPQKTLLGRGQYSGHGPPAEPRAVKLVTADSVLRKNMRSAQVSLHRRPNYLRCAHMYLCRYTHTYSAPYSTF